MAQLDAQLHDIVCTVDHSLPSPQRVQEEAIILAANHCPALCQTPSPPANGKQYCNGGPSCRTNENLTHCQTANESPACSWSVDARPVTAAAVAAQLSTSYQRKIPTISSTTHSSNESDSWLAEPSAQGPHSSPAPPALFESYEGSNFRLKLGGLVSAAQPFSSPGRSTLPIVLIPQTTNFCFRHINN